MTKQKSLTAFSQVSIGLIIAFAAFSVGLAEDNAIPIADAPLRQWTSRYGTKTVARLNRYFPPSDPAPGPSAVMSVELKKEDGSLVRVAISDLSGTDKGHVDAKLNDQESKDVERRLQAFFRSPNTMARRFWTNVKPGHHGDGGYAFTDVDSKEEMYFSLKTGTVVNRHIGWRPFMPMPMPMPIDVPNERFSPKFSNSYEHLFGVFNPLQIAAYEFKLALPSRSLEGKVAGTEGKEFIISVGSNHSVRPRMRFNVLREGTQLKNPDTGKSLGANVRKIGKLVVTEVLPEFSRAIPVADPDDKPQAFEVGDIIRYDSAHGSIAVLLMADAQDAVPDVPLATKGAASDGRLSISGKVVSERFTSELVNVDIPVVERTLLTRVLNQLAIQEKKNADKPVIFDPTIAREFGKQVGASFVVGGTLSGGTANIRLVDIETGEIIKAISGRVY